MQTATTKQREALAKSSRSEFDLIFEKLQKRWTCEQHPQTYCYLDQLASGKAQHISFSPRQWGVWATAIMEGKAIYDYPPRTADFEAMLEDARNNRGTRSKKSKREDSDSDRNATKLVFNHYHSARGFSDFPGQQPSNSDFSKSAQFGRRYSDPSHSPQKPLTKSTLQALKDLGYQPGDWISRGLEDYFKWLDDQFQGMRFLKSLTAVQAQDIGLDSFEGMKADFLANHCNISPGDALRIVHNFRRWVDEKLLEVQNE
jgi:hypothetical protein